MALIIGHPESVDYGNFAEGERPDPLSYNFLNWNGSEIDLSTQTLIEFHFSKDGGTPVIGAGTCQLAGLVSPDTIQNTVVYTWADGDAGMTKGHFVGRFWVTQPNIVRASVKILWYVGDAIKAP